MQRNAHITVSRCLCEMPGTGPVLHQDRPNSYCSISLFARSVVRELTVETASGGGNDETQSRERRVGNMQRKKPISLDDHKASMSKCYVPPIDFRDAVAPWRQRRRAAPRATNRNWLRTRRDDAAHVASCTARRNKHGRIAIDTSTRQRQGARTRELSKTALSSRQTPSSARSRRQAFVTRRFASPTDPRALARTAVRSRSPVRGASQLASAWLRRISRVHSSSACKNKNKNARRRRETKKIY